ncbi:hypothetical protein [Intrasporangium flavum]|uniref:hypothetical protein n=1 Tax=Intrasporangium flavum TaxID=1428657 RepID=UPI001A974F40|nr:hypothetical protein [Intrasporangium flavum]
MVVHDETASGRPVDTLELVDLPDRVTVRELIRHRVRAEVARYNAGPTRPWRGLVTPAEPSAPEPGPVRVDWERQADIAERAFERNGFFVLVGDRQVELLDEEIDLAAGEHVAFVRLVPLVGG